MRRSITRFVLLALLATSGCVRHYAVPADAPTATVILSSDVDGVTVQAFADRQCRPNPAGTRLAYFYRSFADARSGAERSVVAGREFVFTFRHSRYTGTSNLVCEVTKAFVPSAGETYRAHLFTTPVGCDVTLTRAVSAGGSPKELPVGDVVAVRPVCFNPIEG